MSKIILSPLNIVWLKRDLRTRDHTAFAAAEAEGVPYLAVYLFEPSLIAHHDTSDRHRQFVYHSIQDMNASLKSKSSGSIVTLYGEALDVFSELSSRFDIKKVFSYQESGTQITWDRDKVVAHFLESRCIKWTEFQRDGVKHGIKNRENWDKHWFATMHAPQVQNSFKHLQNADILADLGQFRLPEAFLNLISGY